MRDRKQVKYAKDARKTSLHLNIYCIIMLRPALTLSAATKSLPFDQNSFSTTISALLRHHATAASATTVTHSRWHKGKGRNDRDCTEKPSVGSKGNLTIEESVSEPLQPWEGHEKPITISWGRLGLHICPWQDSKTEIHRCCLVSEKLYLKDAGEETL